MNENAPDAESVTSPIKMCDVTVAALRDPGFVMVADVNWALATGEFWVVAGPEHSGKSDWLMVAAGLLPPANGSCLLSGKDTRSFSEADLDERLRVGFVSENGQLFNQLTIAENIALPLRYHKNLAPAETAGVVRELMELMELTPLADVTPANVAANWRQRAALARALALKPEMLLLDNPLSRLGARHGQWWLRFLDQLWRGHERLGGRPMTIVATTDDLRPWQHDRRRFALLHEKRFVPVGGWSEVETSNEPVVKELLAVELETTN